MYTLMGYHHQDHDYNDEDEGFDQKDFVYETLYGIVLKGL